MDIQELLESLRREFPGRNIDTPSQGEAVVELDRDPDSSTAVAFIKRSDPHYHRERTETYRIEVGMLTLYVDGELVTLISGDEFVIEPGKVHYAESQLGGFIRVRVITKPAWSPEDHILVNQSPQEPS